MCYVLLGCLDVKYVQMKNFVCSSFVFFLSSYNVIRDFPPLSWSISWYLCFFFIAHIIMTLHWDVWSCLVFGRVMFWHHFMMCGDVEDFWLCRQWIRGSDKRSQSKFTFWCFVGKSEVPINEASQDLLLMFLLSARPFNQPGQRCCCCVELLVCEYADPMFDS